MLYLHKILPLFVLPVGITLTLVLAGLSFRRRWLISSGVIVLWASSTPLIGALLIRAAEGWTDCGLAEATPTADAIVVLGGGRSIAPGKAAVSQWNDADRFFGGLDLFKAGKAPLLVFTRGTSLIDPRAVPEGDVLAAYAKSMGVPPAQIAETAPVSNTASEATEVARLLRERFTGHASLDGPPRVLLVTSAFHMPRASRLFARAGLVVVAFPVDFAGSAVTSPSVLDFLPSASAISETETAMREAYGRLYYFVVR